MSGLRRGFAVAALVVATGLVALSGVVAPGCASSDDGTASGGDGAQAGVEAAEGDAILARAFADRAAEVQVEGQGTVVRVLADDTDGSKHQRFILRLASGQTLLVAHNIDVASRVVDLSEGDAVAFRGVYEWSEEGGTIHWTHGDPGGSHSPGWLRHEGRTYE